MGKTDIVIQKVSKLAAHTNGTYGLLKLISKVYACEHRPVDAHACSPDRNRCPSPCYRCNYRRRTFDGKPKNSHIIVSFQEAGVRFELRLHKLIVFKKFLPTVDDIEDRRAAWNFKSK